MDFEMENELFQTAEEYFNDNNYAGAEPILNQLVLKSTKRAEVFHMLGTIFYDQGKFNKAIRSYRRALELDPGFTDSSIGLSIILNDIGRYEEGQKVFEEARAMLAHKSKHNDSTLNEKFASKHEELGDLYMRHHRFQDALEEFDKAKNLSHLRKAEIILSVGLCYLQMNQLPSAIKEFRILVREYPRFVPAKIQLGKCYYDSQQVPEAMEQWESALVQEPQNQTVKDYLRLAQTVQVTQLNRPHLDL